MKTACIGRLLLSALIPFFCISNASSIERAMWVWGKSTDIVLDKNENDRAEFFSFVSAPHGISSASISTVFMSIDPSIILNKPAKVREFIADAHSRGLNVQLLAGEKEWGLTMTNPSTNKPYNQPAIDLLNIIFSYNSQSMPEEKFDAVHYDVEPHTISELDQIYDIYGKLYTSDTDWTQIFSQYLDSMAQLRSLCNASGLPFGVDIARFYGTQVQDKVDFITLMDYTIRTDSALSSALDRLVYADSKGYSQSVYVGFETMQVTWKEKPEQDSYFKNFNYVYMTSISFWMKGNQALENLIGTIQSECANPSDPSKNYNSFKGVALHYYEDINNGETAYRNLDLLPYNHAPVCFLISPSGGEVYNSGRLEVKYKVFDQDKDLLNLKIKISSNNGVDWITLQDTTINPSPEFYGNYFVDISSYPQGSQYKVRIEAQEIKETEALTGVDQSDFKFNIKTDQFVPPQPAAEIVLEIDNETYPTKRFPIKWTDFSSQKEKIKGYYYSLYNKNYPHKANFTRSNYGYLTAGMDGNVKIYVWAEYLDGSSSDEVTSYVKIYADLDNDKKADGYKDMDNDGDGVSNTDESLAGTNPNDKLDFPSANIIGLWQFNSNLNNTLSGPDLIITSGSENFRYTAKSGELYVGEKANPTKFSFSSDITPGVTKALSVHMWLKPSVLMLENVLYVPLFFDGDINGGLSLLFKNDAKSLSLRYYVPGKTGVFQSLDFNNSLILDGNWHHVAFTFNGIDGIIELYVDGKRRARKVSKNIVSYENPKKARFFDAESDFDSDNSDLLGIRPNSAQFEHNYYDEYPSDYDPFISCYYFGLVDDIKIFKASVVPDYDYDGIPDDIDLDSDGDGIPDTEDQYPFDTNNNGIMNFSETDIDGDGIEDKFDAFPFNSLYYADTDSDGIADNYEVDAFGNPVDLDPSADLDNDGKTNLEEFISGTKYDDPYSVLKIDNVFIWNDEYGYPTLNISFYTQVGIQYIFEVQSQIPSGSSMNLDFRRQVIGNGQLYYENIDVSGKSAVTGKVKAYPNRKFNYR